MIDKSTRQHYSRGQLVKPGPGRPGYQGWGPGVGSPGPRGGGGGGGGDGGAAQRAREQQAAQAAVRQGQAAAARRSMQATIATAEKQQAESERMKNLAEARKSMTQPVTINLPDARTIQPLGTIDPYRQSHVSPNMIFSTGAYESPEKPVTTGGGMIAGPIQGLISQPKAPTTIEEGLGPVLDDVPGADQYKPVEKYTAPDSSAIGPSLHGPKPEETLQEMIARQQEEKYGPLADPTKLGETIDKRTQKEKDEDWERGQDWDLIKDMSKKGYDFNEIQSAAEKGLTVKAPTSGRRQNLIDTGLASIRNIVPETGLEKSLLSRMKSFVPGAKEGIMSSLTGGMEGFSKYFNPKKMIANYALSKMGLGFLNPLMGLASLMGFNPFKNMGTSFAGVPYKKGPTIEPPRDGPSKPQDIVTAGIKKFQPTNQQTAQMDEIRRKMMILQGYADKGSLNERGQNTLAQMNQMITQYQADPRSIYG